MAFLPSDASLQFGVETTYGTFAAPDRSLEFTTSSLTFEPRRKQGRGMRIGSRVARSSRRVTPSAIGTGSTEFDFMSKGFGPLLYGVFGASSSDVRPSGAFQQIHSLGANSDVPPSFTVQAALPRTDGSALDVSTFLGAQINQMTLRIPQEEIATLSFDWMVRNVDNTVAWTQQPYAVTTDDDLFHFGLAPVLQVGGAVTLATGGATPTLATSTGSTNIGVRDFELTINRALQERFNFRGAGRTDQPIPTAMTAITGRMTVEYDQTTWRDAYLSDTDLGFLLTFQGPVPIAGADVPTLQVAIPVARLDNGFPQPNGDQVITTDISFTVLDGQVATSPIQVVLVTADNETF